MITMNVLLENSAINESVKAKHGLSIAIDTQDNHILLDVGPDDTFIRNADIMQYDLSNINVLVLSHSHSDHTGGINYFSQINNNAKVLLFDDPASQYYIKILGLIPLNVSMNASAFVTKNINTLTRNHKINKSTWFILNTSNTFSKPSLNRTLYKKVGNKLLNDDFIHEGILVIEDNGELVVLNSCSHNGVGNSIESVKQEFKGKKIKTYIGGFHFHNPAGNEDETKAKMDQLCEYILQSEIKVYTGHCTGERNYKYLKDRLGDSIEKITTGLKFSI